MEILVTGGTGYIGSHTVVELLENGYDVVIVDNLSNSSREVLNRIKTITGKEVPFYEVDVKDASSMDAVFEKHNIEACIHFAALKAVGESCEIPLEYYWNNVAGTVSLLRVMEKHQCKNIIFSSSATVYGDPESVPAKETMHKGDCSSPYGWTKSMIEQILTDVQKADSAWNVVLLRYFNPLGAHKSGLIGEAPNGIPNNLMPYVTQVAVGKRDRLGVFGNDYNTPDGTCVRDYVHVLDLATGHVAALKRIQDNAGLCIYNLGTGKGYSVLDVIHNFEDATGVKVPFDIKPRRAGDIDENYADVSKAYEEMGWKARYNMKEMCADSWKWQKMNPNGYDE